jgi:hypothetical protein
MDTLHIKVGHSIHQELQHLSKARGMTISELTRQALITCYQLDLIGLSDRQKQALEAYRGGFISIGKLSELMGRSSVEMRQWLSEHQIAQNNAFSDDDVQHAR